MTSTDRPIHRGWILQSDVELPASEDNFPAASERSATDEDDLPSLKVPTTTEAKAAFEKYFDEKYGYEVEAVLESVTYPNRLHFQNPDDPEGSPPIKEGSRCRSISQLRSDWILERLREKEGNKKSNEGIFRMDWVEPEESSFFAWPHKRWKGSSNLWAFGRGDRSSISIWEWEDIVDWRRIPRIAMRKIVRRLHRQKRLELRLVCKSWRNDIDAEVKSITLKSALLSEIRNPLCTRFETLERLDIVGQVLNPESVERHFPLRHLRALSLRHCRHLTPIVFDLMTEDAKTSLDDLSLIDTDVCYSSIAFDRFFNLRRLTLDDATINNSEMYDGIIGLSRLEYLSLVNCRYLTDECLNILGRHCWSLTELDISQNPQLTLEEATDLDRLALLEVLNIYKCSVRMYGFHQVAKLPRLEQLKIGFDGYETDGLQDFGRLRKSTGLRCLNVRCTTIPFKKVLDAVGYIQKMDRLTVDGCIVQSTCVWWTDRWRPFSELKTLHFHPKECNILEGDFVHLTNCSSLTELSLRRCRPIRAVMDNLKRAYPSLRHLDVGDNNELYSLASLRYHPTLQVLDLSYCLRISYKCMKHVATMRRLMKLIMIGMDLEPEDFRELSKSPTLEYVDVSKTTGVMPDGIYWLLSIPTLTTLVAEHQMPYTTVDELYDTAANPKIQMYF